MRRPLLLILVCILGACEGGADRAAEREPAGAERVVSLVPSATEMILAIGAGDRLIARTEFDTQPELEALPSVGKGLTPNPEWLLARQPDLVVAWEDSPARNVVGRLRELGIRVYATDLQTTADVVAMTRELGRLLAHEREADSVADALAATLDSLRTANAEVARPSVLFVTWPDPPSTAGRGTYIHEVIEAAGGRNLFDDLDASWPQVAIEEIVARQPDVLLVPQAGDPAERLAWFRASPGWRELEAVREGHIIWVDPELFGRPGPRIGEAARLLAERLVPFTGPGE